MNPLMRFVKGLLTFRCYAVYGLSGSLLVNLRLLSLSFVKMVAVKSGAKTEL